MLRLLGQWAGNLGILVVITLPGTAAGTVEGQQQCRGIVIKLRQLDTMLGYSYGVTVEAAGHNLRCFNANNNSYFRCVLLVN